MLKKFTKLVFRKKIIKILLYIKNKYFDGYAVKSYSQEGEDMILRRLFGNQLTGFYVDVGAHHPKRFSNTFFFYKKGWNGINIDAMPGSMKLFNKQRRRDINIEQPISDTEEVLTYYAFNEPALNGFSKKISNDRDGKGDYNIIFKQEMKTARLDDILLEYIPSNIAEIDFLSIDVEGLDFMVLKSLDFERYRPKVILIEILGSDLAMLMDSDITHYLEKLGYLIYAKAVNTVVFKCKNFK